MSARHASHAPHASEAPRGIALALAALRAPQWAHFVVLPLASIARDELGSANVAMRVARGVALAALALAYGYGLNAISDRATDVDRRKNPLGGGACPPGVTALVVATALAALAIAATANGAVLAATAVSLASSTVYSVGPRLKALPVVGTLLNAGIFAPLLFFAVGDGTTAPAHITIAFVALLLQNQLLHERADADEDRAARALTTARVLSERATLAVVAAIGVAGGAAAIASAHAIVVAALALGTAVALAGPRAWARRRVAHRWVSFALGAVLLAFAVAR